MSDLIPGRVDAMFSNLPGVLPQVQNGTIRGMAVTSAKRAPAAPDIPTIGEFVPGYEVSTWWGIFAPRRTSAEIVKKIHGDATAALEHPLLIKRYEEIGAPIVTSSPAQLAALLESDQRKWGPIIKDAGIKAD